MITLYRSPACSFCDDVAARLEEAVLAHEVITLEEDEPVPDLPESATPPVVTEGQQVYTDEASIEAFLDEIVQEVTQNRRVSGDACYIDPESGTCL